MDYIFDRARDLYRPSILRSLGAIADPSYDDSASLAADSDIHSSRKNPYADNMTEVESNFDLDNLETSASDESLLEPWKKYDYESPYGFFSYNLLAFRPSYIIKSALPMFEYIRGQHWNFDCISRRQSSKSHENGTRRFSCLAHRAYGVD
jgi:hypothetical protein